ncbi:LysE family translocator [Aneurinibacillus sp. UBA3580]|jgi:RhtB (resistance to homoserine/threonine) family protein|uniref:LysE family translocator n=1 Tax=Aneurinibacillus sp. UBA3580 TaxID=1946041 RepID=UPI00257FD9F7|nr:LysE family transporter [Aneurinibacillus sp. UBA3580]
MFVEVFLVGILAGISPGPDFFVVMKNSLNFGVRVGVATAIGIACALIVHIAYTVMGFAFLLQQSAGLFYAIQLAGALYLLWLGFGALTAASGGETFTAGTLAEKKRTLQGFRDGFLCNVLNPKAALFFLSVFSQFLTPDTSSAVRWIYGIEIIVAVALWFVTLSFLVSSARFRKFYERYRVWFDRLLGAVLLYFALRIIFTFVFGRLL